MREFTDAEGRRWRARARELRGPDYKGRFFLVLEPVDTSEDEAVELRDVRWNSNRTAARTIATMSTVELRRRLRSAMGRSQQRHAG